jgi:serine/threonine-protein kinase
MIGTRLAHYEITALLGKGGMGEVYRARDTKLKRDIAIKILPDEFSRDSDRVARFQREAEVLASLNHQNIAGIYDLQHSGETQFLLMELVEGETLADRITRGPIPVDEALQIIKSIADALEAAHQRGVIHRDLKPSNVKITPDGKLKVLDFGLAKAMESASPSTLSNSPTLVSMAATNAGLILGTAAYMSPEQAKAKTVDRRTDIWAMGCILFELLTGKPAFPGDSTAEILGNVLKTEPDWSALPTSTPRSIVALLRRCLRKDVQQRPKDAGDLKIEIEEGLAASSPASPHRLVQSATAMSRRWLLLGALVCLGVSAITGLAVWKLRNAPPRPVERFAIALPANEVLPGGETVAFSPDGKRLVYAAASSNGPELYLRAMDALESVPIAGTERAYSIFFSPDSQSIGFFAQGGLKKISLSGGPAVTVCPISGVGTGGAWGPGNTIVFSAANLLGLMKVSAAGGDPQPFTKLQPGEISHRWPQFLPDGKTVLFTVIVGPGSFQLAAQRLDSTEHKILIQGGTYGRYVPTGHIAYLRADTVMAVPFDSERLALRGDPAPVVEGVRSFPDGVAEFSFSATGSLAYIPGGSQSSQNLAWVDRRGTAEVLPAPLRAYIYPRLSPDGRQAAVVIGNDIWTYDLVRSTLTRFTFDGAVLTNGAPVWTPDGKRVVFPYTKSGGGANLFWKPADGSGPEERLTTSGNLQRVGSVSPDGRNIIYTEVGSKTGNDIWVMPLDGDRKPHIFLQTPFSESSGLISPDGHWVAYTSDESGRLEVYVRPFPGPGGKSQVSTDGGSEAAWSPKGNELFYRTGPQREKMMAVDIQTQPTFTAGKLRLLFEAPYLALNGGAASYSVSPDGQRFLMMKRPDQSQTAPKINVVLNWFRELQERVPVK